MTLQLLAISVQLDVLDLSSVATIVVLTKWASARAEAQSR